MLLLYISVSWVLFGSSAGVEYEQRCYGKGFTIPDRYKPPLFQGWLYFTPSNGGRSRLLVEKGKLKDPRFKGFYTITDLTESDDGTFSVSHVAGRQFDVIRLKILDCADTVPRYYGDWVSYDVSRGAEIIEFTPFRSQEPPKVLWNRTDPQTKHDRGQLRGNFWQMMSVTQADSGFYNIRAKDNSLLSRLRLTVEENDRYYETRVKEQLIIQYPSADDRWTVTFRPEGETDQQTVMKDGKVVTDLWSHFEGRLRATRSSMRIDPVEITDAGRFEFRDPQGNLAQIAKVEVDDGAPPPYVYGFIVAGIVFAVIVVCCCVRKCCCKKSSSKRNESVAPQTAAAPAVHYDQGESHSAGPRYSAAPAPGHSYQPVSLHLSREPAASALGPSVAPLGGQRGVPAPSVGSDYLSSDSLPRFELKGLTFPSASPLSSDSTVSDVYTSDKLNFL